MAALASAPHGGNRGQKILCFDQLPGGGDQLPRMQICQAFQPVLFGQHQPIGITVGLVILVVVSQLKLCKYLVDRVNQVRGIRLALLTLLILPSFGL